MPDTAHFIWLGRQPPVDVDALQRRALHTFIRHHPKWGVVAWGNESAHDLVDTQERKRTFDQIRTRLGRVNYLRVLALARYPGIAIDYDTSTRTPVDWLLTIAGEKILVPEIVGKPGSIDVWLICAGQGANERMEKIADGYPARIDALAEQYAAEDSGAAPRRTRYERRYADALFQALHDAGDGVMTMDFSGPRINGRPVPVAHYAMRSWLKVQQEVGPDGI